jgi:hypothetical protein
VFGIVRDLAVKEGIVPQKFKEAAQTILADGWLMKKAYSDHISDERKELGLSSRLTQNKRYTDRVKSKYLKDGGG